MSQFFASAMIGGDEGSEEGERRETEIVCCRIPFGWVGGGWVVKEIETKANHLAFTIQPSQCCHLELTL